MNRFKIAAFSTLLIILGALAFGIRYLQGPRFAVQLKRLLTPDAEGQASFGIQGDFKNFRFYFFPPGLGIEDAEIQMQRNNIAKLPMNAKFRVKEVRVQFKPIQMFSGTLKIDEVRLSDGDVQAELFREIFESKEKKEETDKKLRWEDLLELQVRSVFLSQIRMHFQSELPRSKDGKILATGQVNHLFIEQTRKNGLDIFHSAADLDQLKADLPKSITSLPFKDLGAVSWDLDLSKEGVKLHPFRFKSGGIEVGVEGQILGDILKNDSTTDLKLISKTELNLDLKELNDRVFPKKNWNLQGAVQGQAQIQADLNQFIETLRADFDLKAKKVLYQNVFSDQVQSAGSIDFQKQTLELRKLEFRDERKSNLIGKLKVGSVRIPLNFDQPIHSDIELEHASVDWLTSIIKDELYALEGKVSGKIPVAFVPKKKGFELKIQPKIQVDRLALTNQVTYEKRPRKEILSPSQPVQVKAELLITEKGVFLGPENTQTNTVRVGDSDLKVSGQVTGEGFRLRAEGDLDLKNLDHVSKIPIQGHGKVLLNIQGPVEDVHLDFKVDLRNARFIDINFGDLSGRFDYAIESSQLRCSEVQAKNGKTFYTSDLAIIDFEDDGAVEVPIQVQAGRVEDFGNILKHFTQNISWYPDSLKGEVKGVIRVSGPLDYDRMTIQSDLDGTDWDFFGEKARKVQGRLVYDSGTYSLENARMIKTTGVATGSLSFHQPKEVLKWDFRTDGLTFIDIDLLDRFGVPARSKVQIISQGEGPLQKLKSKSVLKLIETEIKGDQYQNTEIQFEMADQVFRLSGNVFGDQARILWKSPMLAKQPASFVLEMNPFDFTPILLVVNPKLMDDPELKGRVKGQIRLDYLTDQFQFVRGSVAIDSYELQKSNLDFRLMSPLNLPIQLGFFELPKTEFLMNQSVIELMGTGTRGDLDLRVTGAWDPALVELFTPAVSRFVGKGNLNLRFYGELPRLKSSGTIEIEKGQLSLSFSPTPIEEIQARVSLMNGDFRFEDLDGILGEQRLQGGGWVNLYHDRFPVMDAWVVLKDNRVKLPPLDWMQSRGTLKFSGNQPPYQITGQILVSQALYSKSFAEKAAVAPRGERFAPKSDSGLGGVSFFGFDLEVDAPKGFFIRNEIMDAEFQGKVRLTGPADRPNLLGQGSLVQGKILFKDRPFELESVNVDFDDPFRFNPKFNAVAKTELSNYRVRILTLGSTDQWKIELNSVPYLPEEEILSLLASGVSRTQTNRFQQGDRSYVNQTEAASLILHSMNFNKDVKSKTGLQFDLEEAVDSQFANSIFQPRNTINANGVAAPKLVIKRDLGRRFRVSFGSTVGVGTRVFREVNAEYRMSPSVSFLGVWNNIEEVNTREARTSFGTDLRFNKPFK